MKLASHTPFALHVELERSRSRGPTLPVYRPGMGYREGCKTYQPRAGKASKGWRCQQCKTN